MKAIASLEPIRHFQFDAIKARHLLARAGFGGSRQDVGKLLRLGLHGAVDHLVDFPAKSEKKDEKVEKQAAVEAENDKATAEGAFTVDPDIIRPPTLEEITAYRKAQKENDLEALNDFRKERQRRQREDRKQMLAVTNWWLKQMITSSHPLKEKLTLLWHGHFATSYRTVQDSYLCYQQNQFFRDHAGGNFRDLALGIVRDPAMLRYLDNNRNVKRKPNENLARELMELFTLGEGHYSEQDIKEGARALTGYTFRDNDFRFARFTHDAGQKTILGQTGDHDGEGFVNILLKQKACSQFIAYKLYKHFVADVEYEGLPDATSSVITLLAEELRSRDYAISPILKILFKSRHFYDNALVGQKIKSPVELVVGTIRALVNPPYELNRLNDAMGVMGQRLFLPPTVAGWDGGKAWINTSTLYVRQNTAAYLVAGPLRRNAKRYDPTPLLEDLPGNRPEAVVDRLVEVMIGRGIHPDHRKALVDFAKSKGVVNDKVATGILLLITALPEFQLT